MVAELKLRKDRSRFHFFFGESLELCITNEEWRSKFHVIHCPFEFVNHIQLTNILPIVSECLTSEMPEAVLVTEVCVVATVNQIMPLADFVQSHLYCPLTMIPTIYGVKLLDHLRLGSSVCCDLHDDFYPPIPVSLKWNKAPVAYSTGIRLEISLELKKVVSGLVQSCFINSDTSCYSVPKGESDISTLYFGTNHEIRNTPMTFYNIWQPLFDRYNWFEGAPESLIQQCLPPRYQLAWRTLQQWMKGEEVHVYYTTDQNMWQAILSAKHSVFDASHVQFVLKPIDIKTRYRLGQTVDDEFFSNAHVVYNLKWKESTEFAASFLLVKDHRLESTPQFFIINCSSKLLLYSTSLNSQSILRQVVTNSNPRQLARPPSNSPNPAYKICCQESEDEYKLVIDTRPIKLQSSRGNIFFKYYLKLIFEWQFTLK